jgi:hypothetical protein
MILNKIVLVFTMKLYFLKNKFFYFKLMFLVILYYFSMLIFNIFLNKSTAVRNVI